MPVKKPGINPVILLIKEYCASGEMNFLKKEKINDSKRKLHKKIVQKDNGHCQSLSTTKTCVSQPDTGI